jgi:hypothetical protein
LGSRSGAVCHHKISSQEDTRTTRGKVSDSSSFIIVTKILGLHARSLPLSVLFVHAFPNSGIRALVSYLLLLIGSELIRICKI